MTLKGKTALVSGAAGAIGAAIARALATMDAQVVMLDKAAKPLEKLAAEPGRNAVAIMVEVTDEPASRAAIADSAIRIRRIDVLVNNAGILTPIMAEATATKEWSRVMAVKLDAAFIQSRCVLPGMRAARWGRVIDISSCAAECGGPSVNTAYSVSRTAMIGRTCSIARETAGRGITVNAVAPAYVVSAMVSEKLTDAQRMAQLAQLPVGRFLRSRGGRRCRGVSGRSPGRGHHRRGDRPERGPAF